MINVKKAYLYEIIQCELVEREGKILYEDERGYNYTAYFIYDGDVVEIGTTVRNEEGTMRNGLVWFFNKVSSETALNAIKAGYLEKVDSLVTTMNVVQQQITIIDNLKEGKGA